MVDRYEPSFDDEVGEAEMVESPVGDYVDFEAYDELANELQEVQDKFHDLKALVDDIAFQANKIRL